MTDPARELTRRAAAAVRGLAATVPLVILLDTGEVIGSGAWAWMRRVMTQTGSKVIWVLGARFETEAEAGFGSPAAKFVREIGDEHLILISPTRFDDTMIGKYLESRTRLAWTATHVDMIAWFTRGLPLAISLTATLLEQGQLVEDVCRETDDGYPSSVVSQLARRYLVHAEQQAYPADDPRRGDVDKILALALAYADLRADPDLLAHTVGRQGPTRCLPGPAAPPRFCAAAISPTARRRPRYSSRWPGRPVPPRPGPRDRPEGTLAGVKVLVHDCWDMRLSGATAK